MKWIYGIKNKLTASIVLLALCLLVLLSNYLDRLHTENVKNSISTMYQDRLIVEEYILKMTQNTYQIREILIKDDFGSKESTLKKLTENIKTTYVIFRQTRLTKNEKSTADELMNQIKQLEQILLSSNKVPLTYTDTILSSLNKLSEIQLDELKVNNETSGNAICHYQNIFTICFCNHYHNFNYITNNGFLWRDIDTIV